MHLGSRSIIQDLLASLEDHFDQRVLRYAKQGILLYQIVSDGS